MPPSPTDPEHLRLAEDGHRKANWKRWGPYLPERQWGTVREDYSPNGDSWSDLPHDHARSRAYRWGEDGLLGWTDRQCRMCFAVALWNEADPFLKERLFGLTGPQGNHGEDVKEAYAYLDATPTHAYNRARYHYPQRAYPYARLLDENRRRNRLDPEFELENAGAFDDDRYFDLNIEYAKAGPENTLILVTITNRGPVAAPIHVLPTLWARNTWSWGREGEGYGPRTRIRPAGLDRVRARHPSLGPVLLAAEGDPRWLYTENESNSHRLWGVANRDPYVKDAFHRRVVNGQIDAVNPDSVGSKVAAWYRAEIPAGGSWTLRLRLWEEEDADESTLPFGPDFDETLRARRHEAEQFYDAVLPAGATPDERAISRQAYAGLLWSKQVYHYVVSEWLDGDPAQPTPPAQRHRGRNHAWRATLFNRDVISMPDKWEYPWYAAWDLAFHTLPLGRIDPAFARGQIELFVREWYMHPNGQLPAYEFALDDVNPPVHAWAAWRVYKITAARGHRDHAFLAHLFQKMLLNFTWWVNRKDSQGQNLFSGGFLGLDNIGVFDRSKPLPTGGSLEQADGTAWMAFFCNTMLAMALELASTDPVYENLASKFFEHFVAISDAMNTLGGTGLWDEETGFYYDLLRTPQGSTPLRIRSMVGIIPLFACESLDERVIERLPGFHRRLTWFLENRPELAQHISYLSVCENRECRELRLLAIPSRERLVRILEKILDEREFLSPFGIRSLSAYHRDHPYVLRAGGEEHRVDYAPGESTTGLFGGNSNWRGPIWFPVNHLLIEALQRYHHFYGETLRVQCPTGSGNEMNLGEVAVFLSQRLLRLFLPDERGFRPCHGGDPRLAGPWRDEILYHEYFHAETGQGLGACHQTGWTALIARVIEDVVAGRGPTDP